MGAGDVQSLSSVMTVIQLHIITGHAQTHNGERDCVCVVCCVRAHACVYGVLVCV